MIPELKEIDIDVNANDSCHASSSGAVAAISQALSVPSCGTSAAVMRQKITNLEMAIKSLPGALSAKDFETNHHFGPGVYMRELVIPKDTILTGRIHKYAHLNILSKGKITVWTEDGMKTLSAPVVLHSKEGMKRAGYTHEDSIWITVHSSPENETDIKKIEAALFVDTFEEFITHQNSMDKGAIECQP